MFRDAKVVDEHANQADEVFKFLLIPDDDDPDGNYTNQCLGFRTKCPMPKCDIIPNFHPNFSLLLEIPEPLFRIIVPK